MARLRSVSGRAGSLISLATRFSVNGTPSDVYEITSVKIYDAESSGNLIATLTAPTTSNPTGTYTATWDIPVTTQNRRYYDTWVWVAESGMAPKTQTYAFDVSSQVTPDYRGPDAPRGPDGPLFVGAQEIDFFNCINKELIQRIVAQKVTYYSVSEQHTKVHNLYDEAVKKTVWTPVELNALVLYVDPVQTNTGFSIDTIYSIEVYMHRYELNERKLVPREGDFVKYGKVMYEIEKLTVPQITYGQINEEVMVKAQCRVARESQFLIAEN